MRLPRLYKTWSCRDTALVRGVSLVNRVVWSFLRQAGWRRGGLQTRDKAARELVGRDHYR